MIIDVHCHIWDKNILQKQPPDFLKSSSYVTPELLLKHMDEALIDKTVLLGLDGGLNYDYFVEYRKYNDYIASIAREYPDRFIGFLGARAK